MSTTTTSPEVPHQAEGPPRPGMIWIPGGTFRMGSDRHYAEERPVHRVRVDGFWIDRTPVTNREFRRFVSATRHVTFAEIRPDPNDYPDALPTSMFYDRTGHLAFTQIGPLSTAQLEARLGELLAQPAP